MADYLYTVNTYLCIYTPTVHSYWLFFFLVYNRKKTHKIVISKRLFLQKNASFLNKIK